MDELPPGIVQAPWQQLKARVAEIAIRAVTRGLSQRRVSLGGCQELDWDLSVKLLRGLKEDESVLMRRILIAG
eukprot:13648656-Alexandrium_andersonii.AAC.1